MTMRNRKLVGTAVLLVFLAVYALVAMLVAVAVTGNKAAELIFFVVAGLAWTVPAGLLVRWMQRPDPVGPNQDASNQDAGA